MRIRYIVIIYRKQNEALKKQLNEQNLVASNGSKTQNPDKVEFSVIGTVETKFKERRCVPRQPGLCPLAQARITISNSVFTNPNHALEGLSDFSHMW